MPPAWNSPNSPIGALLAGIFMCCLALGGAYTGKVWSRVEWVYRAKEPKLFWFVVAVYLFGGAGFIASFFFLN